MADSTADNLIGATRFSRLAATARSADAVSADVIRHEALATLAEGLDMISRTFAAYPMLTKPDPARLRQLTERMSRLIRAAEPHVSKPSDSDAMPVARDAVR